MKAEITVTGSGTAGSALTLDGFDIAGAIKGFRLDAGVNEITTLMLDPIMLLGGATVTADVPRVHIPDETVELLKQLGWTPPQSGAAPQGGAVGGSVPTQTASGTEGVDVALGAVPGEAS